MSDTFTCRHCQTQREVSRREGLLWLVTHRDSEGFRCEGSDSPAEDNVVEIVRLRELESPKRPIPPKTEKTAPDEQDDAIQRRFERFHERNPQVFTTLAEISMRMKDRGRTRLSISELFEILRYERGLKVDSADAFKFSNDYRSRYVRLLVKTFPEFEGLFELRELRSKAA